MSKKFDFDKKLNESVNTGLNQASQEDVKSRAQDISPESVIIEYFNKVGKGAIYLNEIAKKRYGSDDYKNDPEHPLYIYFEDDEDTRWFLRGLAYSKALKKILINIEIQHFDEDGSEKTDIALKNIKDIDNQTKFQIIKILQYFLGDLNESVNINTSNASKEDVLSKSEDYFDPIEIIKTALRKRQNPTTRGAEIELIDKPKECDNCYNKSTYRYNYIKYSKFTYQTSKCYLCNVHRIDGHFAYEDNELFYIGFRVGKYRIAKDGHTFYYQTDINQDLKKIPSETLKNIAKYLIKNHPSLLSESVSSNITNANNTDLTNKADDAFLPTKNQILSKLRTIAHMCGFDDDYLDDDEVCGLIVDDGSIEFTLSLDDSETEDRSYISLDLYEKDEDVWVIHNFTIKLFRRCDYSPDDYGDTRTFQFDYRFGSPLTFKNMKDIADIFYKVANKADECGAYFSEQIEEMGILPNLKSSDQRIYQELKAEEEKFAQEHQGMEYDAEIGWYNPDEDNE